MLVPHVQITTYQPPRPRTSRELPVRDERRQALLVRLDDFEDLTSAFRYALGHLSEHFPRAVGMSGEMTTVNGTDFAVVVFYP